MIATTGPGSSLKRSEIITATLIISVNFASHVMSTNNALVVVNTYSVSTHGTPVSHTHAHWLITTLEGPSERILTPALNVP